ncbi:Plasmodium variant antigen protein Cir/Yir/Bir/Plasmodium vivax Vir protein, putative [Plasmodium ovale]|uniref:Plasmodium variant antigen protein Cir/Yir/Bir/Plasmodium vivax Vir protein, putative n=1 Tax=Plasmodium ovale TaxID=36330 RepID=A0A1C3KEL8_PLAOA|nr:Plasmodium variant antigen protein Cir/Yir/Bir/Plasmodium vivax Vir protein, putative [Plasmodium ovale]
MGCDTELYRKNYKFFNSIDEYIKYDDLAEINGTNEISGLNYDFINSFNEHKFVDFKKLCNRFVYLVDALRKRNNGSTFNADYDFDYLNYWLNARIHEIDCEIRCKKSFFQNLRAETTGIHNWGNLSSEIYNIEENELNDINTLYNLHKNFKEFNEKIKEITPKKEEYMTYAKNCVQDYQKLKNKCTENKAKFCDILTNFKNKYEKIDLCKYSLEGKTKKKLPSLDSNLDESEEDCESPTKMPDAKWEEEGPDEEDSKSPSDFDTQSITIGSVTTLGISFILFILYKFTSFGQFLLYRMNKNESVWENMDEEMNRSTHASEYEHINSGNSSYNVLYNSV